MNEEFGNGQFYENHFPEILPYLRPAMNLSPMKLIGTAIALIIMCGISITALISFLLSLLFIALLLGKIIGLEKETPTQDIIIH